MTHQLKSTTVLGIIHHGKACMGGDGQATLDKVVLKANVQKVRYLYNQEVLAGFAGSTADAFTLFERFEEKLNHYSGAIDRAAVELAKEWRGDRYLRKLEALLAVMNKERGLLISGQGDVIEPENHILAIGSGSAYAQASARALKAHAAQLSAREMVENALHIAADICIYTNHNLTLLDLE